MPFTGVVRLKDGTTAAFGQVGVESGRQTKTEKAGQSVFMIVTADGGLTWREPKVIAAKEGKDLCEPFALRLAGRERAVLPHARELPPGTEHDVLQPQRG